MLMSMAARIYKHPSIGNSINLVMRKVVIMGDEKLGPEVSDNSGLILRDFCTWQRDANQPRDRHPEHFDTAVLLTREVEGLQTLWGKGRAQCWSRGGVAQMWSQPKCGEMSRSLLALAGQRALNWMRGRGRRRRSRGQV